MTSTVRGVDNFDSSPVRSIIRLHTVNGVGSVATAVRRWVTTMLSQGSDITYTDSATQGGLFLINAPRRVFHELQRQLFQRQRAWLVFKLSPAYYVYLTDRRSGTVGNATTAGVAFAANVAWTGYLPAGSQIRTHCNVSPSEGLVSRSNFTIARVF